MKTLLVTLALSASMMAHANILVIGYDAENEVIVALTDELCVEQVGQVASARTESGNVFIGCWHGLGEHILIEFPDFEMAYKSSMFRVLTPEWKVTTGTIRSTI